MTQGEHLAGSVFQWALFHPHLEPRTSQTYTPTNTALDSLFICPLFCLHTQRLSTATVPFTVISMAHNPCHEDFMVVCGLKASSTFVLLLLYLLTSFCCLYSFPLSLLFVVSTPFPCHFFLLSLLLFLVTSFCCLYSFSLSLFFVVSTPFPCHFFLLSLLLFLVTFFCCLYSFSLSLLFVVYCAILSYHVHII